MTIRLVLPLAVAGCTHPGPPPSSVPVPAADPGPAATPAETPAPTVYQGCPFVLDIEHFAGASLVPLSGAVTLTVTGSQARLDLEGLAGPGVPRTSHHLDGVLGEGTFVPDRGSPGCATAGALCDAWGPDPGVTPEAGALVLKNGAVLVVVAVGGLPEPCGPEVGAPTP